MYTLIKIINKAVIRMKKFLILSLILFSVICVKNTFASDYHNDGYIDQCGGYVDHSKRNENSDYDYTDRMGRDIDRDGHEM